MWQLRITREVDLPCASYGGGPEYNNRYCMAEACPKCGTGAKRIGRLLLPNFPIPRNADVFDVWIAPYMLNARLTAKLKARGFRCFERAYHWRSGRPLPVWALAPQATMPPFSPQSSGIPTECQCPACQRDGHFGISRVPMLLVYEKLDDATLLNKDLLETWECFGNSVLREPFKNSSFALPHYLVSDRLKSALEELKARGIRFEPVRIIGAEPAAPKGGAK